MARLLAFDWDRSEARLVLATARGGTVIVDAVAAVPLAVEGEATEPTPAAIGDTLRRALAYARGSGQNVLAGLDRASVELLPLQLPPATDAELPGLVANEVLRESTVGGEGAAIDFFPLGEGTQGPRQVLAAVLPAPRLEHVQAIAGAAGLKVNRLLLRSLAAASLFARATAPSAEVCLLVNRAGEEVDLIVMACGKLAFVRTVRLPGPDDPQKQLARLLAEIRRTLNVAAYGSAEPLAVESICLFGDEAEHGALKHRVAAEFSLPVSCLDPFSLFNTPDEIAGTQRGRFAALLGMLLDEAHGARHAIDFLHPRRPPRRLARRQATILAAVAVAAVVLLLGGYAWQTLAAVDQQNAELASELREQTELVAQYAKQKQVADAVRDWQASDINWLDELREMSLRFPPQRDAVVLRMTMSGTSGGGNITFQGLVRDPAMIYPLEARLRDQYHAVHSRRIQEGARQQALSGLFDAAMSVIRRDPQQYRTAPEKRP